MDLEWIFPEVIVFIVTIDFLPLQNSQLPKVCGGKEPLSREYSVMALPNLAKRYSTGRPGTYINR